MIWHFSDTSPPRTQNRDNRARLLLSGVGQASVAPAASLSQGQGQALEPKMPIPIP